MSTLHLPKKDYSFRLARPEDVPYILALLYPGYFEESVFSQHRVYSETNTLALITQMVSQAITVVGVDEDDEPFAVACAEKYVSFFEDEDLELSFFYVAPEWRGSGASQDLRDLFDDLAQTEGVGAFYAEADAGIKHAAVWRNLFAKIGFQVNGVNMVKFYKRGQ